MYVHHVREMREELGRLHENEARRAERDARRHPDRLAWVIATLEAYQRELREDLLQSEGTYTRAELEATGRAIALLTHQRTVLLAAIELMIGGALSSAAGVLAADYPHGLAVVDALETGKLAELLEVM